MRVCAPGESPPPPPNWRQSMAVRARLKLQLSRCGKAAKVFRSQESRTDRPVPAPSQPARTRASAHFYGVPPWWSAEEEDIEDAIAALQDWEDGLVSPAASSCDDRSQLSPIPIIARTLGSVQNLPQSAHHNAYQIRGGGHRGAQHSPILRLRGLPALRPTRSHNAECSWRWSAA